MARTLSTPLRSTIRPPRVGPMSVQCITIEETTQPSLSTGESMRSVDSLDTRGSRKSSFTMPRAIGGPRGEKMV